MAINVVNSLDPSLK